MSRFCINIVASILLVSVASIDGITPLNQSLDSVHAHSSQRSYRVSLKLDKNVITIQNPERIQRIDQVQLLGDASKASKTLRYYLAQIKSMRPFNLGTFYYYRSLAKDIIGISVHFKIIQEKLATKTITILQVTAKPSKPTVSIDYDNYGSSDYDYNRLGISGSISNLLWSDKLSLSVKKHLNDMSTSSEHIDYWTTLSSVGQQLGVSVTKVDTQPTVEGLNIDENALMMESNFVQPLLALQHSTLKLDTSFFATYANNTIGNPGETSPAKEKYAGITLGVTYDEYFPTLKGLVSLLYVHSVPWFAYNNNPAETTLPGATMNFNYVNLSSNQDWQFKPSYHARFQLRAQYSRQNLPFFEVLLYGGQLNFGMPYRTIAIIGDSGAMESVQLSKDYKFSKTWLKTLSPYVGVDVASLSMNDGSYNSAGSYVTGIKWKNNAHLGGLLTVARAAYMQPATIPNNRWQAFIALNFSV